VKIPFLIIPAVMTFAAAAADPPAPVVAPTKVAVIQFQEAVLRTQEGQRVAAAMKAKFDPRKQQLDKRQADLKAMQDKLQSGGAAMTEAARKKMQNDVAVGGRALTHDIDDLNAEAQEDEGKAMQSMAAKMGNIIKDYATKNGFAVVLDVSGQTTPVLWAAQSANITAEIVKLYDAANPVKGAAPAPAAPAKK
jgi:outer membrane protein